jgi:transcriptional regulator with XRE-family HTH domain
MPRPQHSERYKRVCRALIDARKNKKITQSYIAEQLGKPQSYVSKYESGERRLDVVEFLDVCSALGVGPAILLRKIGREVD